MRDRIILSDDGLTVLLEGGGEYRIRWDEVHAVSFYKGEDAPAPFNYLTFDYAYGEYLDGRHTKMPTHNGWGSG